MKRVFCIIVFFLLMPAVNVFAQTKDRVVVLPVKMDVPVNAVKKGTLKAGNNATSTHCDYEKTIEDAKEKARAMGGNVVKITRLIEPSFISKCYKIEADVYEVDPLPAYNIANENNETSPASRKGEYATLYIYRMVDTEAFATAYHLHLDNDSVICTVKSKSHDAVNIYKQGTIDLWAETERRTDLKLNVKFGNDYYIRCGLIKGEIRMVPVIIVVDNITGANEYGRLKKGKKNMNVSYLKQIH